jgi:DNA-binding transcriptional regulator YdaS (Cro superfamily)
MTPEQIKQLAAHMGGQKQLAESLGVNPSRVSDWIRGIHKPSKVYLRMLKDLDGITEKPMGEV